VCCLSLDTWLALFGAVSGAIGAASGYYAFVLSGYRLRCQIGIAIHTFEGAIVKIDKRWKGGFGYNIPFVPGSEQLYIQVWNKGRMPVNIDRLTIYQRKKGHFSWLEVKSMSLYVSQSPIESSGMPHRIDFGSSAMWLHPFQDISALSKLDLNDKRWDIRVQLELGDERKKKSRNWLSISRIDDFNTQWAEYVRKTSPIFGDAGFANPANPEE